METEEITPPARMFHDEVLVVLAEEGRTATRVQLRRLGKVYQENHVRIRRACSILRDSEEVRELWLYHPVANTSLPEMYAQFKESTGEKPDDEEGRAIMELLELGIGLQFYPQLEPDMRSPQLKALEEKAARERTGEEVVTRKVTTLDADLTVSDAEAPLEPYTRTSPPPAMQEES